MKPLDLTTVERIERFIVFESKVELLHWEDTSQWGFKIKLGLVSRAELDSFDNTMKRSKKRGGQRYHAIIYGEFNRQIEAQFCGRGWAESSGAHIAVHIPDIDDQRFFRGCNTRDQGEKEIAGSLYDIMLMEIGDDEIIIDQTTVQRMEQLKGGAHSKAVAMMIQDIAFDRWINTKCVLRGDPSLDLTTFDGKDKLIKRICGVESKVEFDHNEDAWQRWETQFHRPFIQYMERQQHAKHR